MLAVNVLLPHNRFGAGSHMVVTNEENCDSQAVIDCVTSIIPGGEMVMLLCFKCLCHNNKYL